MIVLTEIMNNNPYAKNYKHLHQLSNIQNLPNYKLYFIRKNDKQKHHNNKPLTSECGAIIVSNSGIPDNYDVCVYPKDVPNNEITHTYLNKLSHHVDPMVFPLLFPLGDLGWSIGYNKHPEEKTKYSNEKHKSPNKKNKCLNKKNKTVLENTCLTILQYYLYRLSYRPRNFSPLLFGGRLTQQYFLHAYVMIESNRMNYFRNHQDKLRVACYQGLLDHVKCSA